MIKKEFYNNLNEKEKHYYQRLEYYSNEIPTMSINKLADAIYTSPATLSRLVTKLGYKNYKEFKLSFISVNERVYDNSLQNHLDFIIETYPIIIRECLIPITTEASTIYIVSFGNSNGLGQELAMCLGKLGYNVIRVFDSDFIFEIESNVTEKDIVFYISYAGEDIDMQKLAIKLKPNIKQVLLTSTMNAPMSAHVSLIINTHTDTLGLPFQSRLPLQLVITLFCMKLHNID